MTDGENDIQSPTLPSTDDDRRVYEVGFHLIPSLSEEEVAGEVSNIKRVIEDAGGEHFTEGYPKMRALTYTMEIPGSIPKQKYDHAHFGWIKFDATPDAAESVQAALSSSASVIRFLVTRTVRENTLYGYKLKQQRRVAEGTDQKKDGSESSGKSADVSEEEIDKSIEELIVT